MNTRTLWQISVTVAREAEEATAALLERLFGKPASVYAADGKDISVATIYSTQAAREVLAKREALEAGLQFLVDCNLEVAPAKIVMRRVPREDWATSWKKYFKTLEFGSALLIKPTWSKRRSRPGQAVVILDPGLSFGTGQHPTTSFCLEQLVSARKSGQAQSFLDIGTGSGILAIAATKLGYSPVRAFDNDPMSVRVAQANARKNRVARKLTILRQDLALLSAKDTVRYDLICANLVHDLLISGAKRILNRLRPGGKLVLAGLLTSQFSTAEKVYRQAGLRTQTVRSEGEWKSGTFVSAVG